MLKSATSGLLFLMVMWRNCAPPMWPSVEILCCSELVSCSATSDWWLSRRLQGSAPSTTTQWSVTTSEDSGEVRRLILSIRRNSVSMSAATCLQPPAPVSRAYLRRPATMGWCAQLSRDQSHASEAASSGASTAAASTQRTSGSDSQNSGMEE